MESFCTKLISFFDRAILLMNNEGIGMIALLREEILAMKSPKAWLAFKVVAILMVALLGFFLLFNQQIEDFASAYLEVTSKAESEVVHQRRERAEQEANASARAELEKSFGKCGLAEDCRLILTRCRVFASNVESFEKAQEHFGNHLPLVNCRGTPAPEEADYHAECNEEGFCVAVKNAE